MPYIHCPQCRLTIYGGVAYSDRKCCPRCDAEMTESPRPLFRSFLLDGGRQRPARAGPPRHAAGGTA